jgi:hypothetical protein
MVSLEASSGTTSVDVLAQAPAQPSLSDPKVDEAVETTLRFTEHLGDPAYAIEQTLADDSLSQAQKDEYLARVIELAGNSSAMCTPYGSIDGERSQKLIDALERIGTAYTDPATPELRSDVTAAIGRAVDSGRLDAADVYGLVDPERNAISDGARELLTGIRDGAVLNRVADRLLGDAERLGYDINEYERGPEALTAAADIANMAADHGWTASANAIVAEIDKTMKEGAVAGDMTLVQAMMATSLGGSYGSPVEGRTGLDALAGLVNSARSNDPKVAEATDSLFATLVRSGTDEAVGGLDQFGEKDESLAALGTYFNTNISRLIEDDWRKANTGGEQNLLVRDFTQNVLLEPDFAGRDATASAITDEMRRLSGIIDNEQAPMDARESAANSFGTLLGSIQQASASYVDKARGDTEEKVELVRGFTDLVTDKLLERGGPIAGEVGGRFVDAAWEQLATNAEEGAQAHVDDATGGMTATAQAFRDAMSPLDAKILNAFDMRVNLYYRPEPK